MSISPAEFMASTPRGMESNSEWGSRYARTLRKVITTHAEQAPRSQQIHLGPSELGAQCDRQIVAKLVGAQRTNHVSDPWPSIVGTSVHAWLATAFEAENVREGMLRWLTEQAVEPHPLYPGHADLYDASEQAVVDWKVLGATSLAKIKRPAGPPWRYKVQLLLYGRGYRLLGLPVKRVVIAALPRTAATLDGTFVWDHPLTPEDDVIIDEVLRRTAVRQDIAAYVNAGMMSLNQVPAAPDDDSCFFCDFYRPQAAHDGGPGCPGTVTPKAARLAAGQEGHSEHARCSPRAASTSEEMRHAAAVEHAHIAPGAGDGLEAAIVPEPSQVLPSAAPLARRLAEQRVRHRAQRPHQDPPVIRDRSRSDALSSSSQLTGAPVKSSGSSSRPRRCSRHPMHRYTWSS